MGSKGNLFRRRIPQAAFDKEVLLDLIEKLILDLARERSFSSLATLAALPYPQENPSHDSEGTCDLQVTSN